MHYDRLAFTKNGKPTIVAIGNENMDFKMPDMMLSPRDIVEINVLYDCRSKCNKSSWVFLELVSVLNKRFCDGHFDQSVLWVIQDRCKEY